MADATDNFERAVLGGNWTTSTSLSALTITGSSDCAPSAAGANGAWYNAAAFSGDHYSEVVVATEGGVGGDSDGGGPWVRHQSGASTFYVWAVDSTLDAFVYEVTADSWAALGATYGKPASSAGTVIRLDATGSTLTPSINGGALATRSDASITGGAPGIFLWQGSAAGSCTYENWLAGPVSTGVAIVQTDNPAGVTAVSSVTTYTAVVIGAAAVDRIVVVAIGKEVATVVVNSVTIGGVAAILAGGTTFGSMGAWIYYLGVPTGTTADVVVTWSGAITNVQNHLAVYAIPRASAPPSAGTNTSTDMDATAPLTTGSTTIPVDGGMLAVAVGATDTVAKAWANLTEGIDDDVGDFRFTTAKSITPGTATRTCTGTTSLEDGVLVWATFSNSFVPSLLMPPYVPASRPQ